MGRPGCKWGSGGELWCPVAWKQTKNINERDGLDIMRGHEDQLVKKVVARQRSVQRQSMEWHGEKGKDDN